jgi:hypothetical protein
VAWLLAFDGAYRSWFWLCALAWDVLACGFAALVFWATLKTFDRYLVRMPETTGGGLDRKTRARHRRPSRHRLVLSGRG